jgi:cation diffusion facilitator CzcD-associated flavoprotein CzcO
MSVRFDLVIVGAGFAGLYMLHRARGLGLAARVFEAGSGVGGTWYWNRYPGARCDVESLEYSFGFDEALQQEWRWTERYASQPEILRYANHVADRFDLRGDIRFNTRVVAATYDERSGRWTVRANDGAELSAQFLVMATGCLSSANLPDIPGRDSFRGERYHTGRWPHEEVDFTGKRVGVIGTGSSAVQSIPVIAQQAKSLTVFQRTASYTVPAMNGPLDPDYEARIKADYKAFRARNRQQINAFGSNMPRSKTSVHDLAPEERRAVLEDRWKFGGLFFLGAFGDFLLDQAANDLAAEFVRGKIREIVRDQDTARLLSPKQLIGCKRLCIDTGYYETFNRPNVRLVDISAKGIEEITPAGVRASGELFELDALVFATGFDAMTGTLLRMDIRGRGGRTLREAWEDGPRTYLGLGVAGFPNLFTVTGPGSPSVLTNMMVSIEQHVDWIAGCVEHLRSVGKRSIEAMPQAQDAWVAHVNKVADATLYPRADSWYVGANIPGKTRVFMPLLGFPPYVEKCNEVAARGYEGFALS